MDKTFHPSSAIGIFGGTFDPVHVGHMRVALELLQHVPLREIRFVPAQTPVHKKVAHASPHDRVAMLKIALRDHPELIVDEREIHRHTPSYMVTTLESLRAEHPTTPLALILGTDTLVEFRTWHQWETILALTHLLVVQRPGFPLPARAEHMAREIRAHLIDHPKQLEEKNVGSILFQNISTLDISSTALREQMAAGHDIHHLLPPGVWEYIQKHRLYA